MFILTDKFLENMNCDSCYKFLSVGPVKVYCNRRTKCGRCSKSDDDGVISQYNLVVEQAVFKCVNRFDGCKQLLRYDEVSDHESKCHSKIHLCTLCPETRNVPTFLLIKHFQDCHKHYYLNTASFRSELTVPIAKTYLYRVHDNLFFVEFESFFPNSISLNACFLGNQNEAENATQKFIVRYGDDQIDYETDTKTCARNSETFQLKMPQILSNNFVFVKFQIDLLEGLENTVMTISGTRKTISFPRTISLSEEGSSSNDVRLNSTSTALFVERCGTFFDTANCPFKLTMHCLNCSSVRFLKSYAVIQPYVYHLVCHFCERYYIRNTLEVHQDCTKTTYSTTDVCLEELRKLFRYSCVWQAWGCSEAYDETTFLSKHEVNCPRQPHRPCPVPTCMYRGKLSDLKEHFLEIHPEDSMHPFPYALIDCKATHIEKYHYFWAYHGFVAMGIKKNDNSRYYDITIIIRQMSDDTGRPEPRILIYPDEKSVPWLITQLNPRISFLSSVTCCSVLCFFDC